MRMRPFVVLFFAVVVAAACNEKKEQPAVATPPAAAPKPAAEPVLLADRVEYAGHGKLFDKNLKEIKVDAQAVLAMQDSMLSVISKDEAAQKTAAGDPMLKKLRARLQSKDLNAEALLSLKAAQIDKLLEKADPKIQSKYLWRNRAILSYYWNDKKLTARLRPDILEILRESGAYRPRPRTTDYIRDCQAHDVPIPPDWAETGTAWVRQGTLTTNLLSPGAFAAVWTYSDPARRGACIALPRGDGSPGSPAGIICQSATTGHACFWDNKLRSVSPEQFIGWAGQRLRIADLKDGSNLDSSCTGCHRGNNVYLISPDDPTWGKALRGPLNPPRTGTFTTRVESSSDNRGGHPRYIPITTLPERPGWDNPPMSGGCAGSCHEQPSSSFDPPAMPPACASGGVANCYGTP